MPNEDPPIRNRGDYLREVVEKGKTHPEALKEMFAKLTPEQLAIKAAREAAIKKAKAENK